MLQETRLSALSLCWWGNASQVLLSYAFPMAHCVCLISLQERHTTQLSVYIPWSLFQSFLAKCFPCHGDDHSRLFRLLPSQVACCRLLLAWAINSTVLTNNERHFCQSFQDDAFGCFRGCSFFVFLCSVILKARVAVHLWVCHTVHVDHVTLHISPSLLHLAQDKDWIFDIRLAGLGDKGGDPLIATKSRCGDAHYANGKSQCPRTLIKLICALLQPPSFAVFHLDLHSLPLCREL